MSGGNLVVQCTPTSSIALEYRLSPAERRRPGGGGAGRRGGERAPSLHLASEIARDVPSR